MYCILYYSTCPCTTYNTSVYYTGIIVTGNCYLQDECSLSWNVHCKVTSAQLSIYECWSLKKLRLLMRVHCPPGVLCHWACGCEKDAHVLCYFCFVRCCHIRKLSINRSTAFRNFAPNQVSQGWDHLLTFTARCLLTSYIVMVPPRWHALGRSHCRVFQLQFLKLIVSWSGVQSECPFYLILFAKTNL